MRGVGVVVYAIVFVRMDRCVSLLSHRPSNPPYAYHPPINQPINQPTNHINPTTTLYL